MVSTHNKPWLKKTIKIHINYQTDRFMFIKLFITLFHPSLEFWSLALMPFKHIFSLYKFGDFHFIYYINLLLTNHICLLFYLIQHPNKHILCILFFHVLSQNTLLHIQNTPILVLPIFNISHAMFYHVNSIVNISREKSKYNKLICDYLSHATNLGYFCN